MAHRERRQRLALDLSNKNDEEPLPALDQANVEEQFSKLVEDIERIKTGPAPALNHTILDEVENAPGWVRVSRPIKDENAASPATAPHHYFWHPATGQLSWTPPESHDALKSLEMTRAIIADAVERIQNAAKLELPQVSLPAQRAIQGSALLNLLDSLGKEQQQGDNTSSNNLLEQMGSKVWCTVHGCIAAAVAELGAPAPIEETKIDLAATATIATAVQKSDDDMDIEEGKDEAAIYGKLEPEHKKSTTTTAGQAPSTSLHSGKTTTTTLQKKTKIKSSSKLAGKGASEMISKWESVQKGLKEDLLDDINTEAEVEDQFEGDPEGLAAFRERKRLRQAEEWRTEQIRSGTVDGNANFAPVMGDWREKAKKKMNVEVEKQENFSGKEKEETQQKVSNTDAVTISTAASVDLDALSAGLPRGWRAMWDAARAQVYYGNLQTQETQWERPQ